MPGSAGSCSRILPDPDTPATSRCLTALQHQSQDRIYSRHSDQIHPESSQPASRQLHPWKGASATPPAPEEKPSNPLLLPLGHKPCSTSDPAAIIPATSPAKPKPRSPAHEEGEGAESKCPHWVFVSSQHKVPARSGPASQPRLLCACRGAAAGSDFLFSVPIFRLSGTGREGSWCCPWGSRVGKAAPEPRSTC